MPSPPSVARTVIGVIFTLMGLVAIISPSFLLPFTDTLVPSSGGSHSSVGPDDAIAKSISTITVISGLIISLTGVVMILSESWRRRAYARERTVQLSQKPDRTSISRPESRPQADSSPAPSISVPTQQGPAIEDIIARHDELLDDWRNHTNDDIDFVFANPFLADVTEPLVIDHLKAMEVARDLRPDDPKKFRGPVSGSDYTDAVFDLKVKWQAALRRSKRLRDSAIPAADRKLLREAKSLWAIVSAESASMNERAGAAKQLSIKLERLGLAQSSDGSKIRIEIESIQRKALEAGDQ